MTSKIVYQLVSGYMHYTQVLAESTQLQEVLDVYRELRHKNVSNMKLLKVSTVTEEISVE